MHFLINSFEYRQSHCYLAISIVWNQCSTPELKKRTEIECFQKIQEVLQEDLQANW